MEGKGCRLKSCLLLACLLVSACPCPLTAFEELANSSFEASSVTLLAFVDNDDGDDDDEDDDVDDEDDGDNHGDANDGDGGDVGNTLKIGATF